MGKIISGESFVDSIIPFFLLLFLGIIVAASLIYMVYYVWSIPRQPLVRLQRIAKNEKRALKLLGGLLLADLVCWLFRPSSIPFNEWIAILVSWNIWVLCLAATVALGARRAHKKLASSRDRQMNEVT